MKHTFFGNVKLGKLAPRHDERTLKLSKYLVNVPNAPAVFDPDKNDILYAQDGWGQMMNDQLGDCTCAAMGHIVEWWSVLAGKQKFTVPDSEVLKAYEAVAGYDPNTGANDNGAVEVDVLNYWRSTGIAGHKLTAWAAIEVSNLERVKQANWLFGAVYAGVALPVACQNMGDRWDLPEGQSLTGEWAPGSWGGHAVPIISYDNGVAAIVTWGKRVKVTWRFLAAYFDEAYAPLSLDWIAGKAAPNGFDVATLSADLRALEFSETF